MKTVIEYKGPDIHERSLSRKDFEAAGVEFPADTTFKTMHWAPSPGRTAVVLGEDLPDTVHEQITTLLKQDPTFSIKQDDEQVSEAAPNAGHTLADGSNAASGAGGSEVLRSAIGMPEPKAAGTSTTKSGK